MVLRDPARIICEKFNIEFIDSPLWDVLLVKEGGLKKPDRLARERLFSSLENIGDAILGLVAKEIAIESRLAVQKYSELISNEMLSKLSKDRRLTEFFPRTDSDCMEVLFAIIYDLNGYGVVRTLVRDLYFTQAALSQVENPSIQDRNLSQPLVTLILRQYIWKMYPVTRGGGISVRSNALKIDAILNFLTWKAFDKPRNKDWEIAVVEIYERQGFEFLKSRLIESLPSNVEALRKLVENHNPKMLVHFK